jgi:DNA-binding CsgD family transcriptional regulator
MKKLDVTDDLRVLRSTNGIVLMRPDALTFSNHYDTGYTVKSVLQLPCNVYFYDVNNCFKALNDACGEACGFESASAALNQSLLKTAVTESANIIIKNNQDTLNSNKINIIEEELTLPHKFCGQGLTIKSPWYNQNNQVIGIFGLTVVSGKQRLDQVLLKIADLGLLNPLYLKSFSNQKYFSKRENEIIQFILRRLSAKEIGKILSISARTVEKHIENIKCKLNVKTKAELLEKLF